ncbi:hypothetical protein SAMD00019534_083010 [Acytostelium subglobosum LB1]|uniref:hypothetical protein n=1 Tax=Acytostelium subglobosum LB1 TaxID=1410327 RepID=UPI000644CFDF|nr:hypothetical protein SAMD00019534_083010 [Acytostelium subglobosum LB1]GAM25126.1 hypothetical protein SAMD00019534_083010 [Acytostelium subglobosum LB1]|eukprot:XP_012751646.1 hypothetical protein SAMD00019534_083010 [Acytostelium subglobosum LB1]
MVETNIQLRDKRILEIGCGHALPLIYCLQRGAHSTFQDYNHEVIKTLTIPNVIVNSNAAIQTLHQPRFISGDWKHVNQLLKDEKFDIILASDTLYSIQSFRKQIDLINDHLDSGGICLMAAKSFYFGVGGSMFEFKQLVASEKRHHLEVVKSINDGTSNMREIIGIRLKEN